MLHTTMNPLTVTLSSMTAFARQTLQADWGQASWELRTVNHRHLDIDCRLPKNFLYLEPMLRTRLVNCLKRGRVEIYLHYQSNTCDESLAINESLLNQLLKLYAHINEISKANTPPDTLRLLQWPDVLQKASTQQTEAKVTPILLNLFDHTVTELVQQRVTEGLAIASYLQTRLSQLAEHLQKITLELPRLRTVQIEKLKRRLAEVKLEVDTQRFEQELVIALQKMDVAEELERLTFHLSTCQSNLQSGKVRGRHWDFLMQELIRETNTLAAKSVDVSLSLQIVSMKVLIEEMREQIQNIE
jgi:uncharacterized protein (TIGR00255 family)